MPSERTSRASGRTSVRTSARDSTKEDRSSFVRLAAVEPAIEMSGPEAEPSGSDPSLPPSDCLELDAKGAAADPPPDRARSLTLPAPDLFRTKNHKERLARSRVCKRAFAVLALSVLLIALGAGAYSVVAFGFREGASHQGTEMLTLVYKSIEIRGVVHRSNETSSWHLARRDGELTHHRVHADGMVFSYITAGDHPYKSLCTARALNETHGAASALLSGLSAGGFIHADVQLEAVEAFELVSGSDREFKGCRPSDHAASPSPPLAGSTGEDPCDSALCLLAQDVAALASERSLEALHGELISISYVVPEISGSVEFTQVPDAGASNDGVRAVAEGPLRLHRRQELYRCTRCSRRRTHPPPLASPPLKAAPRRRAGRSSSHQTARRRAPT